MGLQEYENEAKIFNYYNGISMEVIKKLYEFDGPFGYLRNIGANIINNCDIIKQKMTDVAG